MLRVVFFARNSQHRPDEVKFRMCFTMDGGGSIPVPLEYCNLHMKMNGGQEIIAKYNTPGGIVKSGGGRVVDPIPF